MTAKKVPAEEPEGESTEENGRQPAENMSATREMPDISAIRGERILEKASEEEAVPGNTADEEKQAEEEPDSAEEEPSKSDEETGEEDLEKILAQATQMFMDNSKVEVPVSGGMPDSPVLPDTDQPASSDADVLPEIQMPEDLIEESSPGTKKGLTREQRELFSYFLPVPGMEEQISQIMMGASERIGNSVTSLTGNILIQGEEGSGKTVLATSLIKAIQKEVGNEDAKIGKISAESLNHKDFASIVPRIAGGYLIVDKAGDLTAETAARMSQVMERNTQGMVVVLEDTREGIKKAMSLNFGFANKFTEKINIPIFTIDELVDFGKSYAEEMECTIDEMGVLALYNRINNIQKLDHATTLAEVKDIVDEAIESAEGGGIRKAFGSIFSKKYNENDYLILREKDFEK